MSWYLVHYYLCWFDLNGKVLKTSDRFCLNSLEKLFNRKSNPKYFRMGKSEHYGFSSLSARVKEKNRLNNQRTVERINVPKQNNGSGSNKCLNCTGMKKTIHFYFENCSVPLTPVYVKTWGMCSPNKGNITYTKTNKKFVVH